MEDCLLCIDGEVELDAEELDEDGITIHSFYTCLDCGAYFVEHSCVEVLDEGRKVI